MSQVKSVNIAATKAVLYGMKAYFAAQDEEDRAIIKTSFLNDDALSMAYEQINAPIIELMPRMAKALKYALEELEPLMETMRHSGDYLQTIYIITELLTEIKEQS